MFDLFFVIFSDMPKRKKKAKFVPTAAPKKRGRGRPRKGAAVAAAAASRDTVINTATFAPPGTEVNVEPSNDPPRRRRGRPRKQRAQKDDGYTPARPFIRELHLSKMPPRFKTRRIVEHRIKFSLPRPRPDLDRVDAVAMAMNRMYLPDQFIMDCAKHTLEYVEARGVPRCRRYSIGPADILHFFAIFQYMGYCRLPAVTDYWKLPDDLHAGHPICTARGFTVGKWKFLFRHIYFVNPASLLENPVSDDDDDESGGPPELVDAFDTSDDESSDDDDDESSDDDDESAGDDDDYQFEPKVKPLYDAFNKGNSVLCKYPGTYVTLDEMMYRFKGKSKETYRMRGKPIREGYKYFSLCDAATKFIWRMFPYGRVSTKCGIIKTVTDLVKTLPDRGNKQYVAAMDNYFTYDSAINKCVDAGVHVCGTAKGKRGWPPAVIKNQDDGRFNSLHHITARSGKYKIYRWVDNAAVYLVSSYHDPKATVARDRKRPRINQVNRHNVQLVWGNNHTVNVEIPAAVDTYNQKKVGVDGADQLIAYYTPKVRFTRTWMSQMGHVLNCIRVNSYSTHKNVCTSPVTAKEFVLVWIRTHMKRANMCVRSARMNASSLGPRPPRRRLSAKNPVLPTDRLNGTLDHQPVLGTKQGKCLRCRYKHLCSKLKYPEDESRWEVIRRPKRKCLGCDVYLCIQCFGPYHDY